MKTILTSVLIIAFILSTKSLTIAQDLTDANNIHLLKPDDKSVGVGLGTSPADFRLTFGHPSRTTTHYNEFAEETVLSLYYNNCVINFVRAGNESDFHLVSFDLQDATIGFGQRNLYVITTGQTVVNTTHPKNSPLFGRIATRSINGADLTKYIKHKGSNINDIYVNEALNYRGLDTDGSLSLIFSGLTLRRIMIEYNVN